MSKAMRGGRYKKTTFVEDIKETREQRDMGDGEPCCVVCFKRVDIYSVGECDHPVCFECSTRMRVLCLQNECPICRHHLHKVIFTPDCAPYKEISTQNFSNQYFERKYKIGFVNDAVKQAYLKLLEHNCKECGGNMGPFRNFEALKEHMRTHDLHFCDLCVANLKIFTLERKCYTKAQLALHRRKGDPDDSSHKGHPLCEFCDIRYMDTDELYRHLRKYHLYCHLCDADGFDHYYGSYDCLKDHFRKEHYLCEEGECSEQNLMAVFRTDIDLKAHKAHEHGRGLSKQAARQARTLEVQFTITPRGPRPQRGPPLPNQRTERDEDEAVREILREELRQGTAAVAIDSKEQFPSLGDSMPAPILTVNRPTSSMVRQSAGALAKTDENFPALGGDPGPSAASTLRLNITHQSAAAVAGPSNAIIKTNAKPNVSIQLHNRPTTASNFKMEPNKQNTVKSVPSLHEDMKKFDEEFPSLSKKDKSVLANSYHSPLQMSAVAKKVNTITNTVQATTISQSLVTQKAPPPPSSSAFPALGPSTFVPKQPQWIVAAKPKEVQPKPKKVAPAPQIPPMDSSDFPSLVSNRKNKKQSKNELNNNNVQSEENKHETGKKEKKKGKSEENKTQSFLESAKKNIPPNHSPDNQVKKVINKENGEDKKSDQEPTWVDWKNKIINNVDQETTKPPAKVKTPPVKKVVPNLTQDFPALDSSKSVPGFKNAKVPSPVIVNNIAKPSYSENLKNSNKENVSKQNGKCQQDTFPDSVSQCNGITFTNSSGQSYNIPAHDYIEPPDFNERNRALFINFMSSLSNNESIEEFKQVSRQFREGIYSPDLYYDHCKSCIGDEFESLFPELLVLLPNIQRQQELHRIYVKDLEIKMQNMHVCTTCGQVLLPDDHKSHVITHNFPTLGEAIQSGGPAWRK